MREIIILEFLLGHGQLFVVHVELLNFFQNNCENLNEKEFDAILRGIYNFRVNHEKEANLLLPLAEKLQEKISDRLNQNETQKSAFLEYLNILQSPGNYFIKLAAEMPTVIIIKKDELSNIDKKIREGEDLGTAEDSQSDIKEEIQEPAVATIKTESNGEKVKKTNNIKISLPLDFDDDDVSTESDSEYEEEKMDVE